MNFLCLLIVFQSISISFGLNETEDSSFIHKYNPKAYPFCSEVQEKLQFTHSFRARRLKNINTHAVYLFTETHVFSLWQMTAALNLYEYDSYVIPELFFDEVNVKTLNEFGLDKEMSDRLPSFNCMFSDPSVFNMSFWLNSSLYIPVKVDVDNLKVTEVQKPIEINESLYGFLQNKLILDKGLDNVIGIDISDGFVIYNPIRVYVKDNQREGKVISFAFYNTTETDEQFTGGKLYPYSFDTAVWLISATSLSGKPKKEQYTHYFELRTQKATFSLFDFQYNRDFLLTGTNEELLGCPPSFCHSREFDDIIQLHDGTKLLVLKEWTWNFTKPGQRIEWKEAIISNIASRQSITKEKNFVQPFKFGIRRIVDGSFTHESTLYIFRNGSFLSSEDDIIARNSTPFPAYTRISQRFKGVPSTTFDAILYHKESRTAFFIKEDKYWAYSLANNALTSEGFPKHIENLGLPYDFKVKSVYVEYDDSENQIKFYLFTENRYIVFEGNEFKDGRFKVRKHTFYCISANFFGCEEGQFACPELPTTSSPPDLSKEGPNLWKYFIILFIIIVVLLAIIAVFVLCALIPSKKTTNTTDNKPKARNISENTKRSEIKPKSGKTKGNAGPESSYSENTRSTI